MQTAIQPKYEEVKVTCSCGETFKTRSTACEDITLEVCSKCHPFYTGQQKLVDTEGRVDNFKRKFAHFGAAKKAKPEENKGSE